MPDIARKFGDIVDRISNRLIWKFASRPKTVRTTTPLVSFTFDDVPDSALLEGAAILERYGVFGTFYIAGGLAGRVEPDRTLISPEGCAELARRGHEIGCHTFCHKAIRAMPGAALAADLDRNARYLHETAGLERPENFAFPYNAAWPPARREFRRRYRTCRAGGEAINRGAVDPLMLKGVAIQQPEDSARDLTAVIDDVVREPGWLIFYGHDVIDKPTPYGCTGETLDRLVRHAVQSGCEILTVSRALVRLGW
ncbi:MAG: polysaccharide deacetylase [Rhizobium sp. 63-7]|nr:MAG: polysaccharide deacetylase [Rhizobium sp. 63-7]